MESLPKIENQIVSEFREIRRYDKKSYYFQGVQL